MVGLAGRQVSIGLLLRSLRANFIFDVLYDLNELVCLLSNLFDVILSHVIEIKKRRRLCLAGLLSVLRSQGRLMFGGLPAPKLEGVISMLLVSERG